MGNSNSTSYSKNNSSNHIALLSNIKDNSSTMKKECQICVENYSTSLFVKITTNCNHKLDICKICVNNHIQAQLESKGDVDIKCPFPGCGQEIKHNDVKKIANKVLFERYDTLMLRQTLSKLPEFRWCKGSGCGSGQINFEGDDAPIMTCEACGKKSCYTHDVPWHEGLTCSEYDVKRQGDDEATKDFLDRETKPCPKCGVRITKDGGCNHMTCKVKTCKYEFCWLCFADFNQIRKNGNRSHRKTCQLYA